MAQDYTKAVAIFTQPQTLKAVINDLQTSGFKHISVLVKSDVEQDEIRTYSTATYPRTENMTMDPRTQPRTFERDLGVTDTNYSHTLAERELERDNLMAGETVRSDRDWQADDLKEDLKTRDDVSEKDPQALLKGSVLGGVLGALAGAAALLIPGVGPVIATGTVASAIGAIAGGSAAGLTIGAIAGVLKDEGIPQDRVELYRDAFEQGKAIVMVSPQEDDVTTQAGRAQEILRRHRPEVVEVF